MVVQKFSRRNGSHNKDIRTYQDFIKVKDRQSRSCMKIHKSFKIGRSKDLNHGRKDFKLEE